MNAVAFWKRHASGVQEEISAPVRRSTHVGMAVDEYVARVEIGQIFLVEQMPVSDEHHASFQKQSHVIRHDGRLQHHLVHLSVAIAAHSQHLCFQAVQNGRHFFGIVLPGQVVAGAVVQQVAQQDSLVGRLVPNQILQLFRVIGGAVEIACKQQFHWYHLNCIV